MADDIITFGGPGRPGDDGREPAQESAGETFESLFRAHYRRLVEAALALVDDPGSDGALTVLAVGSGSLWLLADGFPLSGVLQVARAPGSNWGRARARRGLRPGSLLADLRDAGCRVGAHVRVADQDRPGQDAQAEELSVHAAPAVADRRGAAGTCDLQRPRARPGPAAHGQFGSPIVSSRREHTDADTCPPAAGPAGPGAG